MGLHKTSPPRPRGKFQQMSSISRRDTAVFPPVFEGEARGVSAGRRPELPPLGVSWTLCGSRIRLLGVGQLESLVEESLACLSLRLSGKGPRTERKCR